MRMLKYIAGGIALLLFGAGLPACERQPYTDGEMVYKSQCANCHLDEGQGLGKLIPPLKGSEYLTEHREALACIIRYGLSDTIVVAGQVYAEKMPPMPELNDVDITNVLNYINYKWGEAKKPFALEEVRRSLENCNSGEK